MEELKDRQRIIDRLEENVFVEAGAGAGKTTLIVSRILNQLKQGWEPGSIVVITFTNAAAEELRMRIISRVRKAVAKCTIEAEARNLRNALQSLDRMNISTIHSFCFKLLQERLFDARLPMNVKLLENAEEKTWKKSFFTEWAGRISEEQWTGLLRFGKSRREMLNKLEELFYSICELPEDTHIWCDEIKSPRDYFAEAIPLANLACREFISAATKIYNNTFPDIVCVAEDKFLKAGVALKHLFMNNTADASFQTLVKIKEILTSGNIYAKDKSNPLQTTVNEEYAEWVEQNVVSFLEAYKDELHTEALTLAIKAREAYRRERPSHLLTNDDLLQKTKQLLENSEEARAYFARKYRCIYVDEFQDTDQVQESFIWRLAAKLEDADELRDGALFVVGDPKQSIYRFRGAQPEVYFSVKSRMQKLENASVYTLDENFRSNEKIIEWINQAFAKKEICQEGYRSMKAFKKLPEEEVSNLLAGVYYYTAPQERPKKVKEAETRKKDIEGLGILVRKLIDQKYQITDYTEDNEPYSREIRYSDFLILCHRQKEMDAYQKAMTAVGIPVIMDGEIHPGENKALRCYVRLFDYLTHPYDRMKRVGACETLYMLENVQVDSLLERLRQETRDMSVYTMAVYLQKRMDVLLPVGSTISQSDLLSVQTKLEQMVEQVLAEDNSDGSFMSERFWAYLDKELGHELALEEDAEAVRFMNLHKAKGLEGNIVIITKRDNALMLKEAPYRNGQDYYPAIQGNRIWSYYRKYPKLMAAAEAAEKQEWIRLEYVAVTRPKQALIVMDAIRNGCMLSDYSFSGLGKEASVQDIIEGGSAIQIVAPIEQKYEPEQKLEADIEQRAEVFNSSAPSSLENKARGAGIRAKAKERYQEENPDVSLERKRPRGKEWGTIMHRSLELLIDRWRLDFERCPQQIEGDIHLSVQQAVLENVDAIGEERICFYSEFLKKMLGAFAQWIYEEKLLREAKQVYTELPFSFYGEQIPGMEKGNVWMNGTADLILRRKDDSFLILDYKSDNDYYMTEEEYAEYLRANYQGQLSMYKHAVHRLFTAEEVKIRCGIISFAGEEARKIRYTEI